MPRDDDTKQVANEDDNQVSSGSKTMASSHTFAKWLDLPNPHVEWLQGSPPSTGILLSTTRGGSGYQTPYYYSLYYSHWKLSLIVVDAD